MLKERWKRTRAKHGLWLYPLLSGGAFLFLDLAFRAVHHDASYMSAFGGTAFLFSLAWALLILGITYFLPVLARRIVLIALHVFSVVLLMVHAVIYNVSGHFLSDSDLAFAEDGASFFSMKYLALPVLLYLAFFFVLVLGTAGALMIPKRGEEGFSKKWIPKIGAGVLALTGLAVLLSLHFFYVQKAGAEKKTFEWTDTYDVRADYSLYTEFNDTNAAFMLCGAYQYSFRSLQTSLFGSMKNDKETVAGIDAYFESHPKSTEKNEMTGLFEGKNCIAVLLESMDSFLITEEGTPNLYRLREESINFENHHTPLFLSAGTFNTEFAWNCGFYLPPSGTSAKTYATGVFPQSIATLFRNAGYRANSYHTLDGVYYNRKVVHPLWGYESFHGPAEIPLKGSRSLDTTLMEMYDEFVKDEKFYSYLITYSGHGPYNDVPGKSVYTKYLDRAAEIAAKSPYHSDNPDTWAQYVNAVAHAMECDAFVGRLIERLEADGHINDTVLVFFTDHWCKYLTDSSFVMDCKGVENHYDLCRTPFFIYSKGIEPMTVQKATGSADMLPTVANLFALDFDPTPLAGADAFGPDGGIVPFAVGVWRSGDTTFIASADGAETSDETRRITALSDALLSNSWNVIRTNYFAKKEAARS